MSDIDKSYSFSTSKQIQDRFERRKYVRRIVSVLYIVSSIFYLCWRWTIINEDALGLSLTYFGAECMGLILGLATVFTAWSYKHRTPPKAPEGLKVDVYVPTYKEPADIIRRTAMAARDIRYPHETWLLDDANRPEIKAIAEELGLHYIARQENIDAKAGNLNNGFKEGCGDFIMVFDADHIALPHALDVMLGFFNDKKIGMVQAPQDYYNTDAFQYFNSQKGGIWHDQSFFYNIAQASRDNYNGASCVGTGVVYRRSVVDEIGGIPATTVTEDIHTSLKMHKAGYDIAYLNESIAYGIAAADLEEYYKTRHRWAHGNLHTLVHENVLTCKGISLKQRFSYLTLGLIYLEGWQQLLFFLIPIISLSLGWPPFEITVFNVLVVMLFPFLSYAMLQETGCGFARFWVNEFFSMARWPIHIISTSGLFGKQIQWRSSSKNLKGRIDWGLMAPQITIMTLSLVAVAWAIVRLEGDYTPGPLFQYILSLVGLVERPEGITMYTVMEKGFTVDLVIIAGFWALYNSVRATAFVLKAIDNARNSHTFFRFSVPFPIRYKRQDGRITKISESWASIQLYKAEHLPKEGEEFAFDAILPSGLLVLKLKVETVTRKGDLISIQGDLVWNSQADRDTLANTLYSVDWHREFINRNAYFMTLYDIVMRILGKTNDASQVKNKDWNAFLMNGVHDKEYGIIEAPEKNSQTTSMIVFSECAEGSAHAGAVYEASGAHEIHFKIIKREPMATLATYGLDGAKAYRYQIDVTE